MTQYIIHFMTGKYDRHQWNWELHKFPIESINPEEAANTLRTGMDNIKNDKKFIIFNIEEV